MAGLFFWHNTQEMEPEKVNQAFSSLGYSSGEFVEMGEWNAMVFRKTLYNIKNWRTFPDGAICGTGTFAYKGKVYEQSLEFIYQDVKNEAIDLNAFWGNFVIFIHIEGKYFILRDGATLARLHALQNRKVFSTSFVGLLRNSNRKLNLDKEASTELLCTGALTANQTIVKEIDFVTKNYPLDSIIQVFTEAKIGPSPKTREEAVEQQIEYAEKYFSIVSSDWFNYLKNSKVDISITGGLDSRLVSALVLKDHQKVSFHSHWHPDNSDNEDFRLARNVASQLNLPLYYKEIKYSAEMTEEELIKVFLDGHNSCDGVIRPGTYWDEEFSTSSYRTSLSPIPHLRMSGFGGEQYRNMERLPLKSRRTFESWVRWEMIYRFSGHNFNNRKEQRNTEKRIVKNIEELLGKDTFNLLSFKEYRRQVLVPSYRSFQTNMENRYGFLISPLADTRLSFPARTAYPFMGNSLQFEIDMLTNISMKLAKLPNTYGFDFSKGEPSKMKLGVKFFQKLPPSIKYRLLSTIRKSHKSMIVYELCQRSPFINSLIDTLQTAHLPLDIMKVSERHIRGKIVLNLGYFMKVNKEWLNW